MAYIYSVMFSLLELKGALAMVQDDVFFVNLQLREEWSFLC